MRKIILLIAFKLAFGIMMNPNYNENLMGQINLHQLSQENEPGMHVQVPVEAALQMPELPSGCEVTSLTAAMKFKGYQVDKGEIADKYLPKNNMVLIGNPEQEYLGNPRDIYNGYYCFEDALVKTISNYNTMTGQNCQVEKISNQGAARVYRELQKGNPVVVWVTRDWESPKSGVNGLMSNEHCVVISGFTDATVTIVDPLMGIVKVDRHKFEEIWMQMGCRAVSVVS